MKHAATILDDFGINYKAEVVSAHRTPDLMYSFASDAESNGFKVIIAGAGGAAHLPGMIASKTNLPVLGVPIKNNLFRRQRLIAFYRTNAKRDPCCNFCNWRSRRL